jgi:peptidoglycan hydrolase-like protein with peptidoglycan-binding domain
MRRKLVVLAVMLGVLSTVLITTTGTASAANYTNGALTGCVERQPILTVGSRGKCVVAIQYLLKRKGYSISVDGAYGSQTRKVVRAFQDVTWPKTDGIVGPNTWNVITAGCKYSYDSACRKYFPTNGISIS